AEHDIESFGVGLHQTVFDAVMDHFNEVAGSGFATIKISQLCGTLPVFAACGFRDVSWTRSEGCENRIEPLRTRSVAADHQTITAFQAPNPAAGTDIEIFDAG